MSALNDLLSEVTLRMRKGDTFESVEQDLINPSALSDREKGALWIYGWSFVHWRSQRREALRLISELDAGHRDESDTAVGRDDGSPGLRVVR